MVVNVAFYQFLELAPEALPALRERLLARCEELALKGTILLAPEGINAFLAGTREAATAFRESLASLPELAAAATDPSWKESESDHQPFNRMLVRLKKEIIAMGTPDVSPTRFTGKRLKAAELKRWLDEGRELAIVDTRNDYEVRLGTFRNAVTLELATFRQFPSRVAASPELARLREEGRPVVTFCTGGIRCEKASALLLKEGFREVYQLDGGILRYFEEVGGAHFDGECFVFDQRVAVDACLRETGAVLCYACQNPVTLEEQRSPQYVYEVSCPHCFGRAKAHKERIARELKGA